MAPESSVRDFYRGKSVLVTGGTGFMGKVLLEKLLYSIPDIGNVYVLMRPKKGKSIDQRLEAMQRLPLFDRVRNEKPETFAKIIPLQGDVLFDNFGLSEREIENLSEEVSVLFHFAASLRLEAPLKDNVNMNTCGTQRALNVAKKLKNLLVFIHLSTAFCYPDYEVLEEKVHAPPVEPSKVMHLIEWLNDEQVNLLTPSILGPHPNCYTFSKRLAESVVQSEFKNLPVVIVRPSIGLEAQANVMKKISEQKFPPIVIGKTVTIPIPSFDRAKGDARNVLVCPAFKEPVAGWVDSLNGPVGLMLGAGKGVIRTMLCDGSLIAQVVPVDTAINAIIAIGMIEGSKTEKSEIIPIYNVNVGHQKPTTWGDVLQVAKDHGRKYPLEWPLWYPNGDITTNAALHEYKRIFYHLVPAYIIDMILFLLGQKRFMVRIQDRISQGLEVLQYFTMRPWHFPCPNYDDIQEKLNDEEKIIFNTDLTTADRDEYMKRSIEGGRIYCLKEDPSKVPLNRYYHNFLYILDWAIKIFFGLILFSFLATKFNLVKNVLSYGEPVVNILPMLGPAVIDENA